VIAQQIEAEGKRNEMLQTATDVVEHGITGSRASKCTLHML